ncbi:phage tail protein, partial [Oleiphilus sp. HI0079]|uniref:phage tail protein n=2 Tax=Oleiphilus TaxID=141450 RepID=UPI000A41EFCE
MKQTLKTLIAGAALTVAATSATHVSAEPFLGEIAWVPYNFAPRGWQFCDGQLLPINQYSALFSLLGT